MSQSPRFTYVSEIPQEEITYITDDAEYVAGNPYHIDIIEADSSWDYTEGSEEIVVGILDLACMLSHEDLVGKVHLNSEEIEGDGLDNDGNGYVDDCYGYAPEHLSGDSIYIIPNPNSQTHGTIVTGVIEAETNNSIGIASVGNKVKFIPVDIDTGGSSLGFSGDGFDYLYSRVDEIDVINCSFGANYVGFEHLLPAHQAVIDEFYAEGVIIVGSAGNNDDTDVFYPGNLNHAIAVAATTETDEKHGASCYHKYDIDISAPGAPFKSLNTNGGYTNFSHTSAAAPAVSSVCALMRSIYPEITVDQMHTCMYDNADPVYGTYADSLGAGRVNALQSVLCAGELKFIAASAENITVDEPTTYAYPNPCTGSFSVILNYYAYDEINIQVLDMKGAEVAFKSELNKANGTVEIELVDTIVGNYFVKVKQGSIINVHQVIVE
ncbi:MAG: S8 family peptidase [Crocinitomicaceae bacterium]|nr:S8 family peptidase [Crocinitomicaceae bacterium]